MRKYPISAKSIPDFAEVFTKITKSGAFLTSKVSKSGAFLNP